MSPEKISVRDMIREKIKKSFLFEGVAGSGCCSKRDYGKKLRNYPAETIKFYLETL